MHELAPAVEFHVVNTLGWHDLRPLQRAAVGPVRSGADCLLLAPTAGGKTEAAMFPLLSEMAESGGTGLTVLYITPLRALLNNLEPRLAGYASWIGRRVGLWHGDTTDGDRRRLLADPPDILLTTPESLEAMLIGRRVDHASLFRSVRTVVVDELHAFAGDDRGWHLLAVLERLQRLAGRRIQRVGLTATVGNPDELLRWLGGSDPAPHAEVVAPSSDGGTTPDVTLDYVGSVSNAATVVEGLHRGEKRLVFSDSRAQAEDMANELRRRGVVTFVSHSSLSREERRRSEAAFAEARDCVVVATSTLELGIDVGDLDRVIQLESPRRVASFLQRLGRTGRRPGTARNSLFLATREDSLLRAAALMLLWGRGFVEPVVPPPSPRHIAAQQLLALALQEGRFGASSWRDWWGSLPVMDEGEEILAYLRSEEFLAEDSGLLHMGPRGEREFGFRHFMDLTSVFTSEPEFSVLHGRRELGSVSPLTLSARVPPGEPRVLLLAGRPWRVTAVDWRRRVVQVVEERGGGRSRWTGGAPEQSRELTQAMRDVLLGEDPPVTLSRRATSALAALRDQRAGEVDPDHLVLESGMADTLWTFAGTSANRTIAAALSAQGLEATADAESVRAKGLSVGVIRGITSEHLHEAMGGGVTDEAVAGLKFSAALPFALAAQTLAERGADVEGATDVIASAVSVTQS
jgi:ATP-dependent Lhr-like helicase